MKRDNRNAKLLKFWLKQFLLSSKRQKKGGFTLLELLITTIIAAIIIVTLLSFVVDLVNTDRREYARSETQRETQLALNFMVDDLRQAVYVYDRVEQVRDNAVNPLAYYIPTITDGIPILAFWKAERLPYSDTTQSLPTQCATNNAECNQLLIRRRSYSLIVYYQVKNPTNDPLWKGKYRIERYIFRKYTDPVNLSKTSGYKDPAEESSFQSWPYINGSPAGTATTGGSRAVLVDFVDEPNSNGAIDTCTSTDPNSPMYVQDPSNPPYRRVPADITKNNFFVCVKTLGIAAGTNVQEAFNQDVIVYLRGNPTGKLNPGDMKEPMLTLRTQAIARGVIDKKPQ